MTTETTPDSTVDTKPSWKDWFVMPRSEGEPPRKRSRRTLFNQIVLIFVIGCIFGTYWEEIMHLVTSFIGTGTPVYESRRGLVYGPFSPVYGIGAVLIYLLFYLPRLSTWVCFLGGAIFGGALEYLLSVIQEWIFGTISWDYSELFLNIGGRTTIPYMIVWGGLVMILAQWLCPFLEKIYWQVRPRQMNRLCTILAVIMLFDISMSVAAVLRQTMRDAGNPADKGIEIFLDNRFPDERLRQIYSNTRKRGE